MNIERSYCIFTILLSQVGVHMDAFTDILPKVNFRFKFVYCSLPSRQESKLLSNKLCHKVIKDENYTNPTL